MEDYRIDMTSPLGQEWQDYLNSRREQMAQTIRTMKEKSKMSIYDNIYEQFNNTSLKGKLKPITCPMCKDNGNRYIGECETCLANQAYNREYIETHTFIYDKNYQGYHEGYHDNFKRLFLRLPNEHPYLYYGIEIEVEFNSSVVSIYSQDDDYYDEDEEDGDDNWKIQEILDKFSEITEGMFVYERDGSLDNGVECISRPTSYAYWTHPDTVKKLKAGLEFLREKGAYVNQPNTNGLHIHLSRKFFDMGRTNLDNRDVAYESFDWLFQKFQPEIEQLGGREYTHYCASKAQKLRKSLVEDNYAIRSYNVEAEIKCKLKKGGRLPQEDHYSAVNLTRNTIEARVFKSSTDYKQVLANIEIVRNMAHAVREQDIKRTLNDILHTKDNIYLDELISKTQRNAKKNNKEFNLDRVCDDEIEVVVKQEGQA